jgi:hypothetical protein
MGEAYLLLPATGGRSGKHSIFWKKQKKSYKKAHKGVAE